MNLFLYSEANPVNIIDPYGLASYIGLEAQFILGGGVTRVTCCDEDNKKWVHVYVKICLGAAFDFSGSGGSATNSDGKSCSNPPKNLLGVELGVPIYGPFGGEGGLAFDTGGGGASATYGAGGGVGAKLTVCYYKLIKSQYKGSEDCCE
jgi:hypothetical protein